MNLNKLIISLVFCITLPINTKTTELRIEQFHGDTPSIEKQIDHKTNMILEWASSQTPQELEEKKDTAQFLNPRKSDDPATITAKRIAKNKLFPPKTSEQNKIFNTPEITKGYWESYAPQSVQNAAVSLQNYTASWIPQSIKDHINTWSTKKKLAVAGAALGSLLAIYNKDQIIDWITEGLNETPKNSFFLSYEEKKQLGLPLSMNITRNSSEENILRLQDMANELNARKLKLEEPLSNQKDEISAQKIAQKILKEYNDNEEHHKGSFLGSLLNKVIYKEDTPIMNRARAIALQTINPQKWEDGYYL